MIRVPSLESRVSRLEFVIHASQEELVQPVEPKNLLPEIVSLARRAGDAILQVYAQQFEVTTKGDQSPLTLADLHSHEIIIAGLRSLTPEIPVLSEEASDIPFD